MWEGANIVADVDDSNITVYFRGVNLIYADEDGEQTYYHFNAHGDVVVLTNESGEKEKTYSYTSFGVEYNLSTFDTNPFRYCGEYYDTVSGMIYLRARYYNSDLGRFTQQDGWGFANPEDPLSLNLYTYCWNNPIMYVDYNGRIPIIAFLLLGSILTLALYGCNSSDYFTFNAFPQNDFDVWNSIEYKAYTNCYAYAFNMKINPLTGEKFPLGGMQPGMLSGEINYENLSLEDYINIKFCLLGTEDANKELVRLITEDMNTVGINFQKYEEGMSGGYRVALVVAPKQDYHWYRDNGDGTWSHKPGMSVATNCEVLGTDENGNIVYGDIITDPIAAAEKSGYSVFVGYYYVSPQ